MIPLFFLRRVLHREIKTCSSALGLEYFEVLKIYKPDVFKKQELKKASSFFPILCGK
jgi:hypothetical protein